MRFLFDPPGERPNSGIRLVGEIPDFRICHLEGRNGAGKSLALRLLELISGSQPYSASPAAWESLRAGLGETTVTIEGLAGQTLRVQLRPSQWLMKPEPVDEWLGEAYLDDRPIEMASVSTLLRVIRISGDETFERTIQQRLAVESATIQRAHGRFEAQLVQLQKLLDHIVAETAVVVAERNNSAQLDLILQELAEVDAELRPRQDRLSLLEDAVLARNRLSSIAMDLPEAKERLQAAQDRVAALEEQLRTLQERRSSLLAQLASGPDTARQLKETNRLYQRRKVRHSNLANQVEKIAAVSGVSADAEAVETELEAKSEQLEKVNSELRSVGHSTRVRELASDLGKKIALYGDLENEVVALLDSPGSGDLRVQAHTLRHGLKRRQLELMNADDDPSVQALMSEQRSLLQALGVLTELRGKLNGLLRAEARMQESEAALRALVQTAAVTGKKRKKYEAVCEEIATLETEIRECLTEETKLRVDLDQISAGRSAEELEEHVRKAAEKLEVDEAAIDEHYRATKQAVEDLRVKSRQLKAKQIDGQNLLVSQRAEVAHALAAIAALPWMPPPLRDALVRPDEESKAEALVAMRGAVEAAGATLYQIRDAFDGLTEAAKHLAREVGARDRTPSEIALLSELSEVMGERLCREFNQEEIRRALFDDGQIESVDLQRLEAHWITRNGEYRSRPFEAFSSGERVFAYTRARIAQVASVAAQHRVIALDEFGAFVARDRLERLARYLRDAVIGKIADQVIIVVPLAANYAAQEEMTTGDLRERFRKRAEAISQVAYFAEDASERELA